MFASSSAEDEVDSLLLMMRQWPDALPPEAGDELRLHVAASKELLRSPILLAAARHLMVEHFAAAMLRPVVVLLTRSIDAQVQEAISAAV